jgi:hypothetical protein
MQGLQLDLEMMNPRNLKRSDRTSHHTKSNEAYVMKKEKKTGSLQNLGLGLELELELDLETGTGVLDLDISRQTDRQTDRPRLHQLNGFTKTLGLLGCFY